MSQEYYLRSISEQTKRIADALERIADKQGSPVRVVRGPRDEDGRPVPVTENPSKQIVRGVGWPALFGRRKKKT